jgi:glycosyltransferase involved in cell wall biosynthesis
MRVLHVVGALDPYIGGSTTAAIDTCGHLRRHGVDAVVAGTWDDPSAADYITNKWPGLPVHGFTRQSPRHYWNSSGLRRWMRAEVGAFDLVCVHGVFKFPFVDAARAARARGVPYVVQPHGSLDPYDLQKHRSLKALFGPAVVRPLLGAAAGVIVTAEREAQRLVTFGARPRVQALPLAVPGPPERPSGGRARRKFGLGDEAEVVVFFSRIDPKKGLERLLEACASLRPARPNLRLLVVGGAEDPDYVRRVHDVARRLAVDDIVTWAGFLLGAEKWDALAAGDVFALPSDNENFGMVVVEALLAGTPALISDEVYLGDDLQGIGAVTICARDAHSVAHALARLLDDPAGLRDELLSSRPSIDELFSPDSVTRRTVALYDGLARSRSPG